MKCGVKVSSVLRPTSPWKSGELCLGPAQSFWGEKRSGWQARNSAIVASCNYVSKCFLVCVRTSPHKHIDLKGHRGRVSGESKRRKRPLALFSCADFILMLDEKRADRSLVIKEDYVDGRLTA